MGLFKFILGCQALKRCILYLTSLILAYSWAMPAILVAGKGRGGMYLFLLCLHFHSCSSVFPVPLFHLLFYLFYHSCSSFFPVSVCHLLFYLFYHSCSSFFPIPLLSSTLLSLLSFLFFFLPCSSLSSTLLSLLSFLFFFLSCSSLSSTLLSLFSLFLGDDTKWPTRIEVLLNSQHNLLFKFQGRYWKG